MVRCLLCIKVFQWGHRLNKNRTHLSPGLGGDISSTWRTQPFVSTFIASQKNQSLGEIHIKARASGWQHSSGASDFISKATYAWGAVEIRKVVWEFLVVQWLALCAFTAKGLGSIFDQRTKISQATWHGQKNKENKILSLKKKKERKVLDPPRLDVTWTSAANFNSIQQKWFAGILFRRTGISKTRCSHRASPPVPLASGWVWGWPGAAPGPITIRWPLLSMLSLFML